MAGKSLDRLRAQLGLDPARHRKMSLRVRIKSSSRFGVLGGIEPMLFRERGEERKKFPLDHVVVIRVLAALAREDEVVVFLRLERSFHSLSIMTSGCDRGVVLTPK